MSICGKKQRKNQRTVRSSRGNPFSARGGAALFIFDAAYSGRTGSGRGSRRRKDSGKLWEVEAFNGISAVEYMKKRLHQEALPASRECDGVWGEIGSGLEEEELVLPFWTGAAGAGSCPFGDCMV
ncbi:MAG: hypothetical protein V8S12_00235 [Lachnospiraceae bacterium]